MSRLKKLVVYVAMCLFMAISILLVVEIIMLNHTAHAETIQETEEPTTEPEPDEPVDTPDEEQEGISELVDSFTAYLQEKYGADYEYYYNQIIDNWGSVENYLLSFGDKLPEEYRDGWTVFVGWLGEYSVVWAPAFAVIIVVIVAVIGKKKFDELIKNAVDKKVLPIITELNKQSEALVALTTGTKALLPAAEKYNETRDTLDKSVKELTNG